MYHGNLHCEKLHAENRGRRKYSLIIRVSESKEMHYVHYCAGLNHTRIYGNYRNLTRTTDH